MTNAPSRSHSLSSDERGIALAIAMMAIVVIGALETGTFFA
jgi:Tfp pilus assembly protein PilX